MKKTLQHYRQRGEIATLAILIGLGIMVLGIVFSKQIINTPTQTRSNAQSLGSCDILPTANVYPQGMTPGPTSWTLAPGVYNITWDDVTNADHMLVSVSKNNGSGAVIIDTDYPVGGPYSSYTLVVDTGYTYTFSVKSVGCNLTTSAATITIQSPAPTPTPTLPPVSIDLHIIIHNTNATGILFIDTINKSTGKTFICTDPLVPVLGQPDIWLNNLTCANGLQIGTNYDFQVWDNTTKKIIGEEPNVYISGGQTLTIVTDLNTATTIPAPPNNPGTCTAPPAAPTNVQVNRTSDIGSSSGDLIYITWTPPTGPVTSYQVDLVLPDGSYFVQNSPAGAQPQPAYTASISSSAQLTVHVRAINTCGTGTDATTTTAPLPANCQGIRHCAEADSIMIPTCDTSCTDVAYTCTTYTEQVFTTDQLTPIACGIGITPPANPNPPANPAATTTSTWYAQDGRTCDASAKAGSNYQVVYTGPGCTGNLYFATDQITPQSACSTDGTGACFIPTGDPTQSTTVASTWIYNGTGSQYPTQQCVSASTGPNAMLYSSVSYCSWGSSPPANNPILLPAPPGVTNGAGSGPVECQAIGGTCDTVDACHTNDKVVVANGKCSAASTDASGVSTVVNVCCLPVTSLKASATSPFCKDKTEGFYKDPSDNTCYQCAGGLFIKADNMSAYGFPTDAAKCVENAQCDKQFGIIDQNNQCFYCLGTKHGESYGYATQCPSTAGSDSASKEGNQGFYSLMSLNSIGQLTTDLFNQIFSFFKRTPGQLYEYWNPF